MDTTAPTKPWKVNHWLPYWAVFQMDIRQTARSWVFRVWFAASLVLGIGYLLHRAAIHHQAGLLQSTAGLMHQMLQFSLLVGTTLVIVLTAGTISSERGIVADSVLSRGISRYQYFLGKWHARLITILGSFVLIAVTVLVTSCFLLQMDVSIVGSLLAFLLVAAILAIVISCGITISSMCQSTVLAIAILWMALYGVGVGLYVLQYGQLNPARLLRILQALLRGEYSLGMQATLIGWCALASVLSATVGLLYFSRSDV